MSSFNQVEIPDQYKCPITLEIMSDPIVCTDGFTYERASIMALCNSFSPMTRQPIDKKILIPNNALKQLIQQFAHTNSIKLKKHVNSSNPTNKNISQNQSQRTNQDRLSDLQREQAQIKINYKNRKRQEREGMLSRFEREQIEQNKINSIRRYNEKQEKKRKEEQEKQEKKRELEIKRKEEQENRELERIVTMFNAKDLPILMSGWRDTNYDLNVWCKYMSIKFKFTLGVIKIIKNKNIKELYSIYKKLCLDIMWIQKYVYGSRDSKPFVDFVFDYKDKNSIDYEIKNTQHEIDKNNLEHSRHYQCNGQCAYIYWNNNLNSTLKELINLKNIIEKIQNKSREYYYINYDEFLDLFCSKDQMGHRNFIIGRESYGYCPVNLDSATDYSVNGVGKYIGNRYYNHIFHIFDREKKEKINFLVDICKDIGIIRSCGSSCLSSCGMYYMYPENNNPSNFYYGSGDLIEDHIKYINYSTLQQYSYIRRLIEPKDFDEFVKIGKVIIELIEFIRPDIVLMSQDK